MVKRIILIIAIAMIAFSGVALAADTASVNVSATVVGACKFINKGGVLPFGNLDPSVAGDVNNLSATQPTFWCTKNASYTIADTGGAHDAGTTHRMIGATNSELIPYTITFSALGSGQGRDTTLSMNISGQVLYADFKNASADSYSDTVTLSITP
jgi:spore coat protein U-like protein